MLCDRKRMVIGKRQIVFMKRRLARAIKQLVFFKKRMLAGKKGIGLTKK